MGNDVVGIIQGAGQLVAEQTVTATDYKGAAVLMEVVADPPLYAIVEAKLTVRHGKANRGIVTAGGRSTDARMVMIQGRQLLAGEGAVKGLMSLVERNLFLIHYIMQDLSHLDL